MPNDGPAQGVISGRVIHGADNPVRDAEVWLKHGKDVQWTTTDETGRFRFESLQPTKPYVVECTAFGARGGHASVTLREDCLQPNEVRLQLGLDIKVTAVAREDFSPVPHLFVNRTGIVHLDIGGAAKGRIGKVTYVSEDSALSFYESQGTDAQVRAYSPGLRSFKVYILDTDAGENSNSYAETTLQGTLEVLEPDSTYVSGEVGVQLKRTQVDRTPDQVLWSAIRLHTRRIGFGPYQEFINRVLCSEDREALDDPKLQGQLRELSKPMHGVGAYEVLRVATEAFLLRNCGVRIEAREGDRRFFHRDSESARLGEPVSFDFVQHKLREYLGSPPQLPYISRVINDAFPWEESDGERRDNVLTCRRLNEPCLIELIWSYWHEEGMLAQAMNAVARRFQNLRSHHRDPLANLEIDPLRPLNNILWGFIQDEFRRLTVKRRAYEYNHQYGLTLYGKAVSHMHPADSRSKFIEAFHNLLHLCALFFKEDNDTTVIADGYPLLHALKEVHLLLAQGAQNQFGDLPWTARAEMLLQQWMLARPEIRDFLQSRAMVPYKEAWMPQVDTMKTLQGWSDVTVTHFRDLGVYGEQILLSVRYGDWVGINDEDSAKNWARYWRPEIQGYLHAYRAATGSDLSHADTVDSTLPSVHLQNRLATQQQRMR